MLIIFSREVCEEIIKSIPPHVVYLGMEPNYETIMIHSELYFSQEGNSDPIT